MNPYTNPKVTHRVIKWIPHDICSSRSPKFNTPTNVHSATDRLSTSRVLVLNIFRVALLVRLPGEPYSAIDDSDSDSDTDSDSDSDSISASDSSLLSRRRRLRDNARITCLRYSWSSSSAMAMPCDLMTFEMGLLLRTRDLIVLLVSGRTSPEQSWVREFPRRYNYWENII